MQCKVECKCGEILTTKETHEGCMCRRDQVSVLYSLSSLLPAQKQEAPQWESEPGVI